MTSPAMISMVPAVGTAAIPAGIVPLTFDSGFLGLPLLAVAAGVAVIGAILVAIRAAQAARFPVADVRIEDAEVPAPLARVA